MKKLIVPALCILGFPLSWPSVSAADYQGANALLEKLSAEAKGNAPGLGSLAKLRSDVNAFPEASAKLAPEEAANQWLALMDRFAKLTREELQETSAAGVGNEERMSFQTLIAALPAPAAWDALVKQTEAMPASEDAVGFRATLLKLTTHWLTHDSAAAEKDHAALDALLAKTKGSARDYAHQQSLSLSAALLHGSDDGEAFLKWLNAMLDESAKKKSSRFSGNNVVQLEVPDLVSLVGAKKTEDFLRRALATKGVEIEAKEGDATRKLAQKLALEMVRDLKLPQWSLAESLDATELFEAMTKKFPDKEKEDPDASDFYSSNSRDKAQTYYLFGLLAKHRKDDASALAFKLGGKLTSSLTSDAIRSLEKAGLTRELADFFHGLLGQKPELPLWSEYIELAAKVGATTKMVALAEAAAAKKDLPENLRAEIQQHLIKAYLAANQVDKGVELLRRKIASAPTETADEENMNFHTNAPSSGLAWLGVVLRRPELIEEGIQALRASLKTNAGKENQYVHGLTLSSLAQLLIELNRGPEAETLLAETLIPAKTSRTDYPFVSTPEVSSMIELMALYHRAKRPADVITLLDHATQWGVKDLADIYTKSVSSHRNTDYAGYFAAYALAASDRKPEARKIVAALLDHDGSYDPAFELMLQLEPETGMARLDALFARDKFEERPLIWKAKLLFDQGKLEEAESVARQAISIDPSDGEQGHGRRMRVYAVLADIREARGDTKEAAFFRGVVTSIRHSEEADRFYEAGLLSRAVKMYEESLTHFADAYCIQSRLALRMAEMGFTVGAEEHYRRAYELMPDSFGRVESHCFGCEQAFAGERAQSIAEKVFTELAAKRPEKPQVHYLLGYLRHEQGRHLEALPEFREAVKLDPDYLNAWKMLADIGKSAHLPAVERQAIQLGILKLDPLGRHSSFEAEDVSDWRVAWVALDAASKTKIPEPEELYPLKASAEVLEKLKKEKGAQAAGRNRFFSTHTRRKSDGETSPGKMLSEQSVLSEIGNGFDRASMIFP